jgi:hypothetical protein
VNRKVTNYSDEFNHIIAHYRREPIKTGRACVRCVFFLFIRHKGEIPSRSVLRCGCCACSQDSTNRKAIHKIIGFLSSSSSEEERGEEAKMISFCKAGDELVG